MRGRPLHVPNVVLTSVSEYSCGKIVLAGTGWEMRCRRTPLAIDAALGSHPSSVRPDGMLFSFRNEKSLVADVVSSCAPEVCGAVLPS